MRGCSSGLTVSAPAAGVPAGRGAKPGAGGVWAAAGIDPTRLAARRAHDGEAPRNLHGASTPSRLGPRSRSPPLVLLQLRVEQDSGETGPRPLACCVRISGATTNAEATQEQWTMRLAAGSGVWQGPRGMGDGPAWDATLRDGGGVTWCARLDPACAADRRRAALSVSVAGVFPPVRGTLHLLGHLARLVHDRHHAIARDTRSLWPHPM